MAEIKASITLDNSQYNRAIQQSKSLLEKFNAAEDDQVRAFQKSVRAMEQAANGSKTTKQSVRALTDEIEKLHTQYNNLSDSAKKGEFGTALKNMMTEAQGKVDKLNKSLKETSSAIDKAGSSKGLSGLKEFAKDQALSALPAKFGELSGLLTKLGPMAMGAGAAIAAIGVAWDVAMTDPARKKAVTALFDGFKEALEELKLQLANGDFDLKVAFDVKVAGELYSKLTQENKENDELDKWLDSSLKTDKQSLAEKTASAKADPTKDFPTIQDYEKFISKVESRGESQKAAKKEEISLKENTLIAKFPEEDRNYVRRYLNTIYSKVDKSGKDAGAIKADFSKYSGPSGAALYKEAGDKAKLAQQKYEEASAARNLMVNENIKAATLGLPQNKVTISEETVAKLKADADAANSYFEEVGAMVKLTPKFKDHIKDLIEISELKAEYNDLESSTKATVTEAKNALSERNSAVQARENAQRLAAQKAFEEAQKAKIKEIEDFDNAVEEQLPAFLEESWNKFNEQVNEEIEAAAKDAKHSYKVKLDTSNYSYGEPEKTSVQKFDDWKSQKTKPTLDDRFKEELDSSISGVQSLSSSVQSLGDTLSSLKDIEDPFEAFDAVLSIVSNISTMIDTFRSLRTAIQSMSAVSQLAAQEEAAAANQKTSANMGEAISETVKQDAKLGPIVGTVVGLAAAATLVAFLIAQKSKTPKFATGGIVGGTSYTGDKVHAMVNSGEMVLNKQQQANLFSIANGGGHIGSSKVEVVGELRASGRDLKWVLQNQDKFDARR